MDWTYAIFLFQAVSFVTPLVMALIVPARHKPTTAIAWLLLITLLPVIGLLLYLLFGRTKLPRRRREQQRAMDEWTAARVAEMQHNPRFAPLLSPAIPSRYQPFAHLNAGLGGLPVCGGNRVELLTQHDNLFCRLIADIEAAQRYIHLEFFALGWDADTEPVFAALERAAGRGVKVRVLLDHFGSMFYPHYRATRRRLTRAGIEHQLMLPIRLFDRDFSRFDLRNHRKLVVVDGAVGYTGSYNLIERNYYTSANIHYDELMVHVTGPVVMELQAVFVTDWYAETGVILSHEQFPELSTEVMAEGEVLAQLLPSGPGHAGANNLALFTALVYAAERRLVLVTPYFVPDESLMLALTTAARRGVEVTLINSEAADQRLAFHAQRSYYADLLRAGVRIFLRQPPVLVHSKTISVDDDIAVIGSSNLDIRSFLLDLEVTLVIPDRGVVADLRRVEAEYLRRSRPIELRDWLARPWWARLPENVARLTSALQ